MNKLILFIATSKDGFIADKNGGVDWLPQPQNDHDLAEVGYTKLMERIDTIVMGRKSYEQILGFGPWGWEDKQTHVFTSKTLESPLSCISITKETPFEFIQRMKNRGANKDIWLLGGAQLAQSLAHEGLIDEIILTLTPQNLGEGIPLGVSLDPFELTHEKPLMDGMIQRVYVRKG